MANRILLVDDEPEFVELLRYRLKARGYECVVARNGIEALNLARQFLPDLILLDILLPDLDGLSVCEILHRQPSTHNVPVILLSALGSDVTRRAGAMIATAYFTKPVNMDILESRIAEVLNRAAAAFSAWRESEPQPD